MASYGTWRRRRQRPRQQGGPDPARGGGVPGQGVLRRGDPGDLGGDEAWDSGSPAGHTGQAAEQAYQQEEGSRGAAIRGDQAAVQRGPRAGDHCGEGQGEDGLRLPVLQPRPAEHAGRRLTAWAIDLIRYEERNGLKGLRRPSEESSRVRLRKRECFPCGLEADPIGS
jgi:hypothetical protein